MTRRRLSAKARAAIFNAANGICHICDGGIQAGEAWQVEHIVPIAMGGADEPDNMRPAHDKCHKAKTKDDMANIAKAKRIEARDKGFSRPKQSIPKRPFPGKRERTPKTMPERKPLYRSADNG